MLARAPQDRRCSSDSVVLGPEGGIAWRPATVPARAIAQAETWIAAAPGDPECAALSPATVPARMSWTGPEGWCGAPVVDGQGDIALSSFGQSWILPSDGSSGAVLASGSNENATAFVPRERGFLLLTHGNRPSQDIMRELRPDGREISSSCTESAAAERIQAIVANPLGGYVEAALTQDQKTGRALWLRWVDARFHPLGDWHDVIKWPAFNRNHRWQVLVDRKGKALVLSFVYPPSIGGLAPPSEWQFSARWMEASGPLGDSFVPPAPTFTPASPGKPALFADWGTALPLADGGFAMFVEQARPSSGGSISPSGWYARYPSGEARAVAAPKFLEPYGGSVKLLASGAGYAAAVREPGTCTHTAVLVARSGRACFKLGVADSDLCDSNGTFSPDGTFVVRRGCELHWWPGLARARDRAPAVVTSSVLPRGDFVVGTQAMEGTTK